MNNELILNIKTSVIRLDESKVDKACSRTCLAYKTFAKTIGRRYADKQPGTESGLRPTNKSNANRWLIAGQPRVGFLYRLTLELVCSCF